MELIYIEIILQRNRRNNSVLLWLRRNLILMYYVVVCIGEGLTVLILNNEENALQS